MRGAPAALALALLLSVVLAAAPAAGAPSEQASRAAPAKAGAAAAAAAAASLQVCARPGQCVRVPRYPVRVNSSWECPPFATTCEFRTVRAPTPAAARVAAAPVSELAVVQFPKIVGSQVAMPLYQFTSEHHVLEAARRLLAAGSTAFKFDLKNQRASGKPIAALEKRGWLALVTHGELPYQTLFDMPFRTFIFWAGRTPPPGRDMTWTDIDGIDVYAEMRRLTTHLLKRYNNSGKSFWVGHWEGDWAIRDAFNKDAPANPKKVAAMIKLLSDKQRAIDDAKRAAPWAKNVFVWHYAEANLVEQSMKRGRAWASMVNTVIGAVKPALDYVSISVGGDSLREWNPSPALHRAMDAAAAALPAKAGVPQPRVFVGEFYFDMRNRDDNVAIYAPTPELQRARGCWAAASAVAWGAPHVLWWTLFDNEQTRSGAYRGYGLVDAGNRDTPLFKAYQAFYSQADEYVRSVLAATGRVPGDYAFRSWAVDALVALSGRPDAAPTRPPVRYWGS
ncbi:hypothetical protein HT031_000062 [Scenedesmus sp. PABB004]|nr:hypothetical protein HT031_000062 [Scenedesmus sp. PABB004]